MEPTQSSSGSSLLTAYSIPLSIVVAGALIAVGLYLGLNKGDGGAAATNNGQPQKVAVDVKNVKVTADTPYIGKPNAPVTLAYWSDYQCPFCKAVEVGGVQGINIPPSIPTLIKNYVDTGKLRIVFKDFPFLGNDSITAAMYAHAIWATYPDQFYAWRSAMFKAQDQEGDQGFGNETTILALIRKQFPTMDANKLKALVATNADKYKQVMDADEAEGQSFGITGTPGFITGTQSIDGAVPLSNFTAAIDPQLK